jgi:hypothetical protein
VNNPGRVNSGDSLGRVTAALAVVLGPAAMGVLLAFEVGALLLARERETPARSE